MNMSVACCCCTCLNSFCAEAVGDGSTTVPCSATVTVQNVTLLAGCFTVTNDRKFIGAGSVNGTFTLRWFDPGSPLTNCSWKVTIPNLVLRIYASEDTTCTGAYTDYPLVIVLYKERDVFAAGWTLEIRAENDPNLSVAFMDTLAEPDECNVESLSFTNEYGDISQGDGTATVTF